MNAHTLAADDGTPLSVRFFEPAPDTVPRGGVVIGGAMGVLRLLGAWDQAAYERSFGGHLYAFLRPMAQQQPGVVFARPSFADVQRWERELLDTSFVGAPEALVGGAP